MSYFPLVALLFVMVVINPDPKIDMMLLVFQMILVGLQIYDNKRRG